jgi:hypothetical protein
MNQLRCAYAGAVLSSGLTPGAGEKALPQGSPVKAIPCFRPRRFPHSKAQRLKPPSYEDANCHRIVLLPAHFCDGKLGDHAHPTWRQRRSTVGFIVHVTNPSAGGFDTLTGYYIGLDVSGNQLTIGREDNSWTNFIEYPAPSVTPGSTHHLKVTTQGNALLVYLDNVQIISINDATNNLKPAFLAGAFGLRRFGPSMSASNITINTYPNVTSPIYDFSKIVGRLQPV